MPSLPEIDQGRPFPKIQSHITKKTKKIRSFTIQLHARHYANPVPPLILFGRITRENSYINTQHSVNHSSETWANDHKSFD